MFTYVECARTTRQFVLRCFAGHWRALLVAAAVSWVAPAVTLAADSQTISVEEESLEHAPALNARVCAPDGVALGGYDLVSYHQAETPQVGEAAIYVDHLGLTYRFANADNRAVFLADPNKYLPNYRGWCSTNLSMGRLACPDYTNYKLEDGKLLFFERVGFTNGLDVWNSDPLLHRRQADQNFALLSGQ